MLRTLKGMYLALYLVSMAGSAYMAFWGTGVEDIPGTLIEFTMHGAALYCIVACLLDRYRSEPAWYWRVFPYALMAFDTLGPIADREVALAPLAYVGLIVGMGKASPTGGAVGGAVGGTPGASGFSGRVVTHAETIKSRTTADACRRRMADFSFFSRDVSRSPMPFTNSTYRPRNGRSQAPGCARIVRML